MSEIEFMLSCFQVYPEIKQHHTKISETMAPMVQTTAAEPVWHRPRRAQEGSRRFDWAAIYYLNVQVLAGQERYSGRLGGQVVRKLDSLADPGYP